MQRWEYLEVFLNYYEGNWSDNLGREGDLSAASPDRYGTHTWHHSGELLNDLGQQGWELVGVEGGISPVGPRSTKWIFKWPSTE